MITIFLLITLLTLCAPAYGAPVQDSTSFEIEIADGWVQEDAGELTRIYPPNGTGVLKIQSYDAPHVVNKKALRNLTNVDLATSLTWRNWGDFSGYQYDYSEGGLFYRQWWLINQGSIIFVVYESDVEPDDADIDELDRAVNSITVNRS